LQSADADIFFTFNALENSENVSLNGA